MIRARLLRFADTVFGVFGYLDVIDSSKGYDRYLGRFPVAEEDWLDNLPGRSCIPAGRYTCVASTWLKTGEATFEITGVPGRSRILFHYGNTEEDVEGCVLLGTFFGCVQVKQDEDDAARRLPISKWGVLESRKAFEKFMGVLAGVPTFTIDVVWSPPGAWR